MLTVGFGGAGGAGGGAGATGAAAGAGATGVGATGAGTTGVGATAGADCFISGAVTAIGADSRGEGSASRGLISVFLGLTTLPGPRGLGFVGSGADAAALFCWN